MKIIKSTDKPFEKVSYASFDRQILIDEGEIPNLYRLGKAIFKKGDEKEDHGHEGRSEIFIIEAGRGIITFNKMREVEVEAGDIVITLPNETHSIKNPFEEDLKLQYFEIKS
jgi:mannose-6-phosphate isomerase-like protein (cupin superfamily)